MSHTPPLQPDNTPNQSLWQIVGTPIILASASASRRALLDDARISYSAQAAHIDEISIRSSCEAEGISPGDIAVILAEMKAQVVAQNRPDALIIGSDQILVCEGVIFGKPDTRQQAHDILEQLQGSAHHLITSLVIFKSGMRIWHHIATANLVMRALSTDDIEAYLDVIGAEAFSTPGCYQIEGPGAHLFTDMTGAYYDILGLPLLPLLSFLREHGLALQASRQEL
ncbi:Maf family protein [Alphaproteobacteria bacterium]|nr:Maf family protein [Alphaproteobacteria bacterium]